MISENAKEELDQSTEFADEEELSEKNNWRNKRTRRRRGQNKLRNLYSQTRTKYGAGAWFDKDNNRLRKYSYNSKILRQSCNRRFRRRMNRNFDFIPDGNAYRRYIDYWWILF
jgi:hypothetical protein